ILFGLVEFTNVKLNKHVSNMRRVVQANTIDDVFNAHESNYPDTEPTDQDKRNQMWELHGKELHNLKVMLLLHADVRLPQAFTFSIEEITSLLRSEHLPDSQIPSQILKQLSFEFGDLKDVNHDHMFLTNPSHAIPFIK